MDASSRLINGPLWVVRGGLLVVRRRGSADAVVHRVLFHLTADRRRPLQPEQDELVGELACANAVATIMGRPAGSAQSSGRKPMKR